MTIPPSARHGSASENLDATKGSAGEGAESFRRQLTSEAIDFTRAVRAPVDTDALGEYHLVHDLRGQRLLGRDELDGGVRAIVPAGARLTSRLDSRDAPLLWRIAYWHQAQDFLHDLAPTFVIDTTLRDVVRRHPAYAEWLLAEGARHLAKIVRFVPVQDDASSARVRAVAERRTLFVYLDLNAAAGLFTHRTTQRVPETVVAALERAQAVLLERPAISGIAALSGIEGTVVVRPPRRRVLLPRREWRGQATLLLMVFMKIYETRLAILEKASWERTFEKLRLLDVALEMAKRGRRATALRPLEELCDRALAEYARHQWDDEFLARLCADLEEHAQWLTAALPQQRNPTAAITAPALDLVPISG